MGNLITFTLTEEVHLPTEELLDNEEFQEAVMEQLEEALSFMGFAFSETGDLKLVINDTDITRLGELHVPVEQIAESARKHDDIEEAKTFCRRLLELLD